uniref:MSHA pilin protein MshD n=1 Tax=Rheinheimera sp. BAL341 TaxID=1708203 RepID=A0A486XHK3_9GAMM
MLNLQRGVTLVEMIVGIVVLAISLSVITSVLGPLFIKSADPWHQVRAAELGQSLMNEIMAKAFDENSSRSGSLLRCGEPGALACTMALGPEEAERSDYDDVDDYHNFSASGNDIYSIFGASDTRLQDVYRNYQLNISVSYDSPQVKRILLTVTTPTGATIEFSSLRGNW